MLPTSPFLVLLHIVVTVGLSLLIIKRHINVATTLSWVIVLSVLPIAGPILYVLFGNQSLGRKRMKTGWAIRKYYQKALGVGKHRHPSEDLPVDKFFQELAWMTSIQTGFFPAGGNKYDIYAEAGPLIKKIVEDIDDAKDTVYLEFYIVDPEGRITDILEALARAAQRGVDVRIMVDDFGGRPFFRSKWDEKLQSAGVDVVHSLSVNPIKAFSKRTDLRNHRKLIVIDKTIGYTGSFNLTDPQKFKQQWDFGEWVDVMVRLEGHIISSLSTVFNTDYIFDSQGMDYTRDDLSDLSDRGDDSEVFEDGAAMQLVPSGPEMERSVIHELITAVIFGARKSVTIVTPYFVPDDTIQLALINAAHRGLDVRLIVPKRVDSVMARYAGESTFDSLMQAGIEIQRFTGGMLHTKLLLIDDQLSLIGTANVDMRSFYLNLEMTLFVYDKPFAAKIAEIVDDYVSKSETLVPEIWAKRSWSQRWKQNILRLASPLL
jgi:cardiolipin synthase